MVWKLHGCVKCGGDVTYEVVTKMVECLQCGLSMTPAQYQKKLESNKYDTEEKQWQKKSSTTK